MSKHSVCIGQVYNNLKIISEESRDKNNNKRVKVLCSCGNVIITLFSSIYRNKTKSCGCIRKQETTRRLTRHGHRKDGKVSGEYHSWCALIQRCTNINYVHYNRYGGRGITVCEEWLNSFEKFLEDMGKKPSKEHSIDRIDNNKGYYKENCKWSTPKEQANNR